MDLTRSNAQSFVSESDSRAGHTKRSIQNMKKKMCIILAVLGFAVSGILSWGIISFRIHSHRSKWSACVGNLRFLTSAKAQWAMETETTNGPVDIDGMLSGFPRGMPICPEGGKYTIGEIGEDPSCSVHGDMTCRRYPDM